MIDHEEWLELRRERQVRQTRWSSPEPLAHLAVTQSHLLIHVSLSPATLM